MEVSIRMRPARSTTFGGARLILLVAASLACSLPLALAPATATLQPSSTPEPPTSTPFPATATATAAATEAASATAELEVWITADGGNLNIRRGPGTEYNVVGFLTRGSRAAVLGKNEDGDWLYLEIPGKPGTFGWVSSASTFSDVDGPAAQLPLTPYPAAVPAYLRNCVFHPMLIKPGDFILPPQFDAPANQRRVNPGHYEAWDQSEVGPDPVLSVDIREGDSVDITIDGFANMYTCP